MTDPGAPAQKEVSNFSARLRSRARFLHPSHEHSALSATLLLMSAVMLSRVIGYLREAYIAWAFGAGPQTDAYVAAFTLPDWLNYLVAGGTASITFISIFSRYSSQGREQDAQRAFDSVMTIMTAALIALVAVAEIFAPQIVRWYFGGFSPEQVDLCVRLTRILLPAQIFFYVGGIVSAVLLSKRLFLYPALGPILYNFSIILGGVILSSRFGIAALAYGAVAGALIGPFLINAIGAAQAGMRYRPLFDAKHPGFREWVRLSIPLMLGVSLVAADEWIMRFFASGGSGDITRLNYAKRLFAVPIAVLGQATGQASLPFFACIFGEKRLEDFAAFVSRSVYRVSASAFLGSAWMLAGALPLVDLVYRRGRLTFEDSQHIAVFFFWFALSLAFWSAQALYSRAFYAAGNTLTPMLAGTIVTAASIPVYWWLYQRFSVVGLAIASDIGILAHTVVIAALLHRKRLVSTAAMPWRELGKALATAALAALASFYVSKLVVIDGSRKADLAALGIVTITWAGAVVLGLWVTRSRLLLDLKTKKASTTDA
jgi:putative peptidoglycan lipid II flippase